MADPLVSISDLKPRRRPERRWGSFVVSGPLCEHPRMPADDSHPWLLGHQPPDLDRELIDLYLAELADRRWQKHLEKLAQRKRDREAAKRRAQGLADPTTEYPWLTDPDWIDRQRVRPFKG